MSDEGRVQARAVANALREVPFDRAIASDLSRATETARIVLRARHLARDADPRLREFDFGSWEGLTWAEIVARWPHLSDYGSTAAKRYQPEGGESFADVTARVAGFLDDVLRCGSSQILVVTHAGVLHAMLAVFGRELKDAPGDPMSLRFSPASITRVAMVDGHARLITLNDVTHLNTAF